MKTERAPRVPFRQRITDTLIEALASDGLPPWRNPVQGLDMRAFNPTRGIRYRGGNQMVLQMEQARRGLKDPRWMTLKQANEAGFRIRKGARSVSVEYWRWPEDEQAGESEAGQETPEGKPRKGRPEAFYSTVFNAEDIIGIPPYQTAAGWSPNALADELIAATGATIRHASLSQVGHRLLENQAYYHGGLDEIVVPPPEAFVSAADYYATVMHEIAHWSGHGSRLARRDAGAPDAFGTPGYAREELVAEIASMHLMSMLGLSGEPHNHASYCQEWLSLLQAADAPGQGKHELFRAARDADVAVNYLLSLAPALRDRLDEQLAANLMRGDVKNGPALPGSELPDCIPAGAAPAPRGIDREDHRWPVFESHLRQQGLQYGIDPAIIEQALDGIATGFSGLMDKAAQRGHRAEDMNDMLARNLVAEIRCHDVREQRWSHFCDLVHKHGDAIGGEQFVSQLLTDMGRRHRDIITQGLARQATQQDIDAEIGALVYGPQGRRAVDRAFVSALLVSYQQEIEFRAQHDRVAAEYGAETPAQADDDDDLLLMPTGRGDGLPDDAGGLPDEVLDAAYAAAVSSPA